MSEAPGFSYDLAFDRNIGWLTEWEQQALRGKCVAIAGMGGVGGVDLVTLARLGIGAFHIADFDRFDLVNFNRQIGAMMSTLGRPKTEVLEEMARNVNPELRITRFDSGIESENIDRFLEGVDLFVDGLDFFVLPVRREIFARCAARGIPAVTAAPIGMGSGFVAFVPGGMSFEEYFRLEGHTEEQQYVRFLMGVAPRGLHRSYLVDPSRVDLAARRGPSTVAAVQLCSGVTAVAAVKLLLGRGEVRPAPFHHHFDAYRGKLAVTKLRFGNAGPVQRLKIAIGERMFRAMSKRAVPPPSSQRRRSAIEEILNVARWAPSGDNAQSPRFRLLDSDQLVMRVPNRAAHDVYEYRDGEPTLISAGMLLESIRIAAPAWRKRVEWRYGGFADGWHEISVRFAPTDEDIDPLYSFIPLRSVDRRPYRARRLTEREISTLEKALGEDIAITWHQGLAQRWELARLSALATGIRLSIPEAFAVHQRVIDWENEHSQTGIPARAVGLDPASLKLMRWAMRDWSRMRLANRLGGAVTARIEMDYIPALASAAFFTMRPSKKISEFGQRVETLLRAGQGIQRFWLTATKLRLAVQPGLATLAFAHYGDTGEAFTQDLTAQVKAKSLAEAMRKSFGPGAGDLVFIGRIGEPRAKQPVARSTRRSIDALIET